MEGVKWTSRIEQIRFRMASGGWCRGRRMESRMRKGREAEMKCFEIGRNWCRQCNICTQEMAKDDQFLAKRSGKVKCKK